MHRDASLAKLYRDFGEWWDVEQIPPGTKWVAVLRESGGDYVRIVAAHDLHALRFRMTNAEREEPGNASPASPSLAERGQKIRRLLVRRAPRRHRWRFAAVPPLVSCAPLARRCCSDEGAGA
jgi:hypothetical protein